MRADTKFAGQTFLLLRQHLLEKFYAEENQDKKDKIDYMIRELTMVQGAVDNLNQHFEHSYPTHVILLSAVYTFTIGALNYMQETQVEASLNDTRIINKLESLGRYIHDKIDSVIIKP